MRYDTLKVADHGLVLGDFTPAKSFKAEPSTTLVVTHDLIDGVKVAPLERFTDARGSLSVLFTSSDEDNLHPPLVYQVEATAGSIRAWNYHCHQRDRLAFLFGDFQIALYDLRTESSTRGRLNVFRAGSSWPIRLEIPSMVVHGVRNCGSTSSSFVNMPTNIYRLGSPDKLLMGYPDPRIPFTFDEATEKSGS